MARLTELLYVCEATTGGIAEYAIAQSKALADAGISADFICRPEFPTNRLKGVNVLPTLPSSEIKGGRLRRLAARIADGRRIARAVTDAAESEKYRHILFSCYFEYFAPLWAPTLRRWVAQGGTVGTIAHDPVRDFVFGPTGWHRLSVREGYSFVKHVFTHDDTPIDFGGSRPEEILTHIIPHGAYEIAPPDTPRSTLRESWGFNDSDRVFLSFGQIRDGKNLDLFLRAMPELPDTVKLLIAGSGAGGSQRPPSYYKNLADELGVSARCQWDIRHIPDESVGNLFSLADSILLTYSAKFRSASGVLNAAVKCRKPMLASSGPGPLASAIDRYELGIFIPPDDQDAIRAAALEMLEPLPPASWDRYEQENSWEENARQIIRAFSET